MGAKKRADELRYNKMRVYHVYPSAKAVEVGDALRVGGGYGFYVIVRRKAIGRKGRTESEAWRNASKVTP